MCEFQYLLKYVMGLPDKPNKKAELGNMVHKGLELIARKRVCEQTGTTEFTEPEIGKTFQAADIAPEMAAREGFEHYKAKNESLAKWTESDFADVLTNVKSLLEHGGGMFNPMGRDILAPEHFFDMPIEEPWAYYDYKDPHTGERIKGQLAIKGTIDLVTRINDKCIEYIDYKTGRRWDWATDEVKTYDKLRTDAQLLLYFYALTRLYPAFEHVFVTIFFTRAGGPFTIPFDRTHDVPVALELLRNTFEQIRNTQNPARIWDDEESRRNKCFKFCHFGKNRHEESGQLLCKHYHTELQTLGIDKLVQKHGTPGASGKYNSGGGRSNRDG